MTDPKHPASHPATHPAATPAPLTLDEYQTKRAALEADLAALETARISGVEYPKYVYHATQPPQIVASKEATAALGAGWQDTPVESAPKAPHASTS
jgi:hypothetical protein